MKLDEIPEEFKDRVEFTCKVCRVYHESITGRKSGCAWKKGDEICVDIERAIEEAKAGG